VKIRRILVRLDPASRGRVVLEAAAALADKMEAELVGLFVENVNLVHLAGFPFAHEVGFPSATRRLLNVAGMERSLRALAKNARKELALVVRDIPVRWSFQVTRGSNASDPFLAAVDADLVVVNMTQLDEPAPIAGVRVVRAGNPEALRAALEDDLPGILVLAGTDDALVGETLRKLLEEDST
jgi:hypothetical protein